LTPGKDARAAYPTRLLVFASIGTFLALSACFAFFGPRIPVADGTGWDGQAYAAMAEDFSGTLHSKRLTTYHLARFFPSIFVGGILAASGIHPAVAAIVNTFALANLVLLVVAAALWQQTCTHAGFKATTTWLGFVFLFVNFTSLRDAYFYPVATDYFAFFFGISALWCYVRSRRLMLWLVTVASFFTWPSAFLVNAALLAFPISGIKREPLPEPSASLRAADRGLRFSGFVLFAAIAYYIAYIDPQPPHLPGALTIDRALLPISFALCLAYAAWLARSASVLPVLRIRAVSLTGVLAFAGAFALHLFVEAWLSQYASAAAPAPSMFVLISRWLVETSIARPLLFAVAHVIWWGPWVVLFIAWLPRVFHFSGRYPGLHVCVFLFAAFFFGSESRFSSYFVPMAVFALCGAIDQRAGEIRNVHLWLIFIVALLFSRFWLPMFSGPYATPLEFPAQLYLMHFGPFMGTAGYLLGIFQVALAVFVVTWVFGYGRRA
jgi:hypothetical protein